MSSLECRGVIFQFSPDAVVFEFTNNGEEEIGMVKPSHLKVRGRVIPSSVKKIDTLSRYIEVGDEITCTVTKKDNIKKFKYAEEDDDGAATEVEIQPSWLADSAVKVDEGFDSGPKDNGRVDENGDNSSSRMRLKSPKKAVVDEFKEEMESRKVDSEHLGGVFRSLSHS